MNKKIIGVFCILTLYSVYGMEKKKPMSSVCPKSACSFLQSPNETFLTFIIKSKPRWAPLLLKRGADPNVPNLLEEYPLSLTVRAGDVERTKMLFKHGADPNIHNGLLFHHAISKKRLKIIALFLKHGVRLDLPDRFGYTAFDRAVFHEDKTYGAELLQIVWGYYYLRVH